MMKFNMFNKNSKVSTKVQLYTGFTLAEVLITLGIIGIVAALTIPTLVSSYQKNVVATKLKKFYSNMYQAVNLSINDNGAPSNWTFGAAASGDDTLTWFYTYMAPYFKYTSLTKNSQNIFVYLSDGSRITFYKNSTNQVEIYFYTEPNKTSIVGKNAFFFLLDPASQTNIFRPDDNGAVGTDRTKWLTGTRACTTSGNKMSCTGLIMFDGWKISDDYPW